jgi:hypothetical protein
MTYGAVNKQTTAAFAKVARGPGGSSSPAGAPNASISGRDTRRKQVSILSSNKASPDLRLPRYLDALLDLTLFRLVRLVVRVQYGPDRR